MTTHDFSQPLEVRGRDLAAVIQRAGQAGYTAHRMDVLKETFYKLHFDKFPRLEKQLKPISQHEH